MNGRGPYKRRSDRYRGLCDCGEHAWAVVTKGYVTFVSPEDAPLLAMANWHAIQSNDSGLIYAARKGNGGQLLRLHRAILGEAGDDTDHVDHDGTNNRRSNLRPCSPTQNGGNSRQKIGRSGFRGVYLEPRTSHWIANIARRKLGTFPTAEAAARAYDVAARARFGEFATLNFPTLSGGAS
jgi:hypothetical protein